MTDVGPGFRLRPMSDARTLYIEEVLGLKAADLRRAPRPQVVGVIVVTPELNEIEAALLDKILAAVQLKNLNVYPTPPPNLTPQHVLAFNGSTGVVPNGPTTFWGLPRLAQMCGDGPEVAAHKRETWAQLKKFRAQYNAPPA